MLCRFALRRCANVERKCRRLAGALCEDFCSRKNYYVILDSKFLRVMKAYDWPGNVRELSNMMHRLSVLHPGQRLSIRDVSPTMLPVGMTELASELLEIVLYQNSPLCKISCSKTIP